MPSVQEKSAFSRRLWFALKKNGRLVKGPTDLARHFNLQYRAGSSVSVQTTHKWLTGRAIPTAEKIKTLAAWLNVTEHWLHYGPPPAEPVLKNARQPSPNALLLAKKIETLPEHQRFLVEELVKQLAG